MEEERKEIYEEQQEQHPRNETDFSGREYVVEDEAAEEKEAEVKPAKEKKPAKKGIVIAALVLAAALLLGAGWYFLLRPAIKFNTTRPFSEAGEEFDAMSIIDSVRGGALEDVSFFGPAGPLAKGVYKYTYKFKGSSTEITVTVRDTKPPKLTLKEDPTFNDRDEIDPGEIVEAEDYGKVTLKLNDQGNDLKVPGMYEVIVMAEDEDKNVSSITAKITIVPYDSQPPKISGTDDTSVAVGSYFDLNAGVSVTDDNDPNPTLVVNANGFTTDTAGTYTVTYTARDASGNEAKVDRIITVYSVSSQGSVWYTPGSDPSVSWDAWGEYGQPYLVAVNRAMCTVTVYGKDGNGYYTVPVKAMACSVGREGHETPISMNVSGQRFHSAWRADWCYMVDGSWGRYAISIDTSLAPNEYDRWGIMFHSVCYYSQSIDDIEYEEYNKLGGPASLGCIRLCVGDELWLYNNCYNEGFPIIIYDDWSSPGPLGKPDPVRIDVNDWRRGWDPTDPSSENPW